MEKSALVLEGGANRGIFTAGVLDYLMDQELWTDYVVGVSAGACNAIDYVSRQPLRSRDCILAWNHEKLREQMSSFRAEHSIMDFKSLFDTFPNQKIPFDYDTFFASDIKCELTVTNCLTGKAEYKSEASSREGLMRLCRASSSIPLLSNMVELDGIPYFDGGLADSIPLMHTRKIGYRKHVVVLTQMKNYRKTISKKTMAVIQARFHSYPNLVRSFCLRPYRYNRCLDAIEKLEAAGAIFVIRPTMQPVKRLEKKTEKLEAFYQHGYERMEEQFQDLLAYLEK